MSQFPDQFRIDVGGYVEDLIRFLTTHLTGFFDAVKVVTLTFLYNVELFMGWLPWWVVILAAFLLGWRLLHLPAGITFGLLLFLVGSFGYWDMMILTLSIVLTSVAISLLIGIPVGILMAYSRLTEAVMRPILDAMQTMPSFVYLIPAIMFFGLGKVSALFATVIYALPPVIRLTNLALREVSREMIEAALSFGSSRWQMLRKVQIPQALPTIMAGVNQTTMMALAMVVIASLVGAKGLGMEVLISINRVDIDRGFEAGLSIVILAIIIDRITQGIANRYNFKKEQGHV
ncbi:glycine betaine/proline transport system permease protein [Planifilum fimeticola]|uniref:Glycine betaine/proline transport system permease protein n=1 Tax=Planifilum fimeticola TaxID=201975 RepID=A0A2T0LAE4_9BACL|nr:proline/glycine betaine ABC transporter permease [Planifilum fimeticola]PRX38769.1 glycine betaine/proline transport system permease protein [Planifilum fimeticola]